MNISDNLETLKLKIEYLYYCMDALNEVFNNHLKYNKKYKQIKSQKNKVQEKFKIYQDKPVKREALIEKTEEQIQDLENQEQKLLKILTYSVFIIKDREIPKLKKLKDLIYFESLEQFADKKLIILEEKILFWKKIEKLTDDIETRLVEDDK